MLRIFILLRFTLYSRYFGRLIPAVVSDFNTDTQLDEVSTTCDANILCYVHSITVHHYVDTESTFSYMNQSIIYKKT